MKLNIAGYCSKTSVLGPGLRAGLWLQGCPFACPGCLSPEWQEMRIENMVSVDHLVEIILGSKINGLTLSGGEPFLQARALTDLIQKIRNQKAIDVICYSGFTYNVLSSSEAPTFSMDLLGEVDLLIDGPYIRELDFNHGTLGSQNQQVYHLTERLLAYDPRKYERKVEIHIKQGEAFLVGVPTRGVLQTFNKTVSAIKEGFSL
ncbi:MAG: radical SAM protein [Anaerolineaceae bacterium]|nr:radical SAM protein [Anaerolineaceae bacterium]